MPELIAIVTEMGTFMRGVASAGVVHDRPRSLVAGRPEFFDGLARLCRFEPDGYRGWIFDYLLSTEKTGTSSSGAKLAANEVERTLRFNFWWVLPYIDNRTDGDISTVIHRQMFEDMAAMFRQRRSFGFGRAVVDNQLLQGREPREPVALSQSQGSMHVGEARLDVRVIVSVLNIC